MCLQNAPQAGQLRSDLRFRLVSGRLITQEGMAEPRPCECRECSLCRVISEATQVSGAPSGRAVSTNHVTLMVDSPRDRQNCTWSVDRRIVSATEQESVRGSRRINPRNQRSTDKSIPGNSAEAVSLGTRARIAIAGGYVLGNARSPRTVSHAEYRSRPG